MIFKQYYLGCLAQASYLIADEETKVGVVVDPQRDIDQYLQDAEAQGISIRYVFLTHFHADFLAGHVELQEQVGAKICLSAQAQAEFPFLPFKDGQVLEFGKVRLKILETPGHTPESISIVVFDLKKREKDPYAVLTGDTLFIGDVGRPDLLALIGMKAEDLAGMLYDSIHQKLLSLPDETLVYPAHGAGSMCGKNLSTDTVSTMGTQRWYNYALQPMPKEEFIEMVTANQPEAPQYFGYDAMLNRLAHPTLPEALERGLKPLSIEEVIALQKKGSHLLDVRDPADFAGGHFAKSWNIGLGGKFATWAGTMLDRKNMIVIVAEPGREEEAAIRLGRIGFDHVAGFLEGGMQALNARPELIRRTDRITAGTLAEQLMMSHPPQVLDVRTEQERKESGIDPSVHIPLNHLADRLQEVPNDRTVVVYCKSGYRSSIAASLLEQKGINRVVDLIGGIEAWQKTWGRHAPTTV